MRWVLLAALSGCTAVFGIDELPPPAPVTGTITHRFINLDAQFTPQLELVPFTALPIEVRYENGDAADITSDPAHGTFSFAADPGERYRVLVTTAGSVTEYQTASPQLTLDVTELGHPDDVAPGAGAELDFMPDRSLTGQGHVATTGVWMSDAATPPMPLMTPLSSLIPQSGQTPALPRAAVHDRVHLFDYTGAMPLLEGVASVDVNPNAPTMVPVTMQSAEMDCATFATHHSTDLARLQALYPAFDATMGQSVTVGAIAKPEAGITADYLEGNNFVIDDAPTVQFAVPPSFAVMSTIAIGAAAVSRTVDGVKLLSFLQHLHLFTPQSMCGTPIIDEDEIALPVAPKLAGTALTTDEQVIALDPSQPAELTFDLDGTQASVFYVALHQVTSTGLVRERVFVTTRPTVLIDPMLLEPGTRYVLEISTSTGLPDARTGDFGDLTYPFAQGDTFTPVFTITR